MKLSIKVDVKQYQEFLEKSPDKLAKALQSGIQKLSFMVERGAKINAPVDTGRLRSSIATELIPFQATIEPHVKYALYVHDGTRFMRARPFLFDSAKAVEKEVDAVMEEELKVLE